MQIGTVRVFRKDTIACYIYIQYSMRLAWIEIEAVSCL